MILTDELGMITKKFVMRTAMHMKMKTVMTTTRLLRLARMVMITTMMTIMTTMLMM